MLDLSSISVLNQVNGIISLQTHHQREKQALRTRLQQQNRITPNIASAGETSTPKTSTVDSVGDSKHSQFGFSRRTEKDLEGVELSCENANVSHNTGHFYFRSNNDITSQ